MDWQIPGLRQELVISLDRQLPKRYAVTLWAFAPNYADAFLARVMPRHHLCHRCWIRLRQSCAA
ncbi:DUF3418 domain-containing protein [Vibrio lentus]|nr:DUF3418 domain-containing protein [Vibrio lentus]